MPYMPTIASSWLPVPPPTLLRQIGAALYRALAFTGNSLAGRYGSPPPEPGFDTLDPTGNEIDEDTMIAVALICAAHF